MQDQISSATSTMVETCGEQEKVCNITMQDVAGGTTTPEGGTTVRTTCGKKYSINATPSSGYKFASWTRVSGQGLLGDASSASTTITPTSNVTIKPSYTKNTTSCAVTVIPSTGVSGATVSEYTVSVYNDETGDEVYYKEVTGSSNTTFNVSEGTYYADDYNCKITTSSGSVKSYESSYDSRDFVCNGSPITMNLTCGKAQTVNNNCSINVTSDSLDPEIFSGNSISITLSSDKGYYKTATLNEDNYYTYEFTNLACGDKYDLDYTEPSYNEDVAYVNMSLSKFEFPTVLNGSDSSNLSITTRKQVYLIMEYEDEGHNIDGLRNLAITVRLADSNGNTKWPFGSKLSSFKATVYSQSIHSYIYFTLTPSSPSVTQHITEDFKQQHVPVISDYDSPPAGYAINVQNP